MPFNKFAFTNGENIQVRPSLIPQRKRHFPFSCFVEGGVSFTPGLLHCCAGPPSTEIHPAAITLRRDLGRKGLFNKFQPWPLREFSRLFARQQVDERHRNTAVKHRRGLRGEAEGARIRQPDTFPVDTQGLSLSGLDGTTQFSPRDSCAASSMPRRKQVRVSPTPHLQNR